MMITDYQSLIEYLAQRSLPPIFFAVTFPKDALGLEKIFPINIVCIDNHPIIDALKQEGVSVFSLVKESTNSLSRRSTTALLRNSLTKSWIDSMVKKNSSNAFPCVLVFKPSPSLEKICQKNNWKLLCNSAKLNRYFENKIHFGRLLHKLNLPQPEFTIKKLNDCNYQELSNKFGKGFFLQLPRGFAGSSTFFVTNKSKLCELQKIYQNRPVKIAKEISGPTYSLNACVTKNNGIIVQRPFYQITNLPELNTSPGGTCGNIYSQAKLPFDWSIYSPLYEHTQIIGQYLQNQGYRGIFGLDFVIDEKTSRHYFIETNPRLTASIPMISKLQIKNNEIPLLALHIMEMLQLDYQISKESKEKISQNPYLGSQIIFRNVSGQLSTPNIYLKSGIYSSNNKYNGIIQLKDIVLHHTSELDFVRFGKDVLDIKKEDEFLILCEPRNKQISPDIEYLRIQSFI